MSKAYINGYSMDRPVNKLKGIEEELCRDIDAYRMEHLREMRASHKVQYLAYEDEIKAIVSNKRLKNKTIGVDTIVGRAKAYFNFRAFDYYLYTLGIDSESHGLQYEGVEFEMYALAQQLEATLHTYGMYAGYNSIHWMYGGGCEEWREAGEPDWGDGKEAYSREDLGNYYY
jgi:hypothetical protein